MSTSQKQQTEQEAFQSKLRREFQQFAQLVETEPDFDQFCATVLRRTIELTHAHCILLWRSNDQSAPVVTHRVGELPHAVAAAIVSPDNEQHIHFVEEVIGERQPMGLHSDAFVPSSPFDSTELDAAPFLMLLSPIFSPSRTCSGALELIQRGELEQPVIEGHRRFLAHIAQLFQQWQQRHGSPDQRSTERAAAAERKSATWSEKLDYVTEVHRHISPTETAYDIANESRKLLNCDRVSVALWNGRRCKIRAISSQDKFDNRANVVKKLRKVATSSVSSSSEFWITGDTEGLAPQVKKQIDDYLDEAHSRTLAVIPLFSPTESTTHLETRRRRPPKPRKLGALIIEYFDADTKREDIADTVDLILKQSQLALENSRIHGEIFLLPVWQRLGWLQKLLFRDHLAKTVTGLVALLVLTALMIFFPKELKMKVDGVMHPTVRQTIFSQSDGIIREVPIDERSSVKSGQTLLQLENPDLELQIADAQLQLETIEHQIHEATSQLSRSGLEDEKKAELSGSLRLLEIRQSSLSEQYKLMEQKKRFLHITSPIDGTVVTPQPKRRLMNFPATANLAVLEVVDLTGTWQLELNIPQNKIGYIDEALKQRQQQKKPEPLTVEFRIGTNPNLNLRGTLVSVASRAVASETGSPTFQAIVDADGEQFRELTDELRTGAGVTAKIHCGTRSLGFVCFYQVIDWLRTNVFF